MSSAGVALTIATDDGLWSLAGGPFARGAAERVGLAERRVTHVARGREVVVGAVPRDGLYAVEEGRERRVWEGDARSCAVGPDGSLYVGCEPAMVWRSVDGGERWGRCDAIDGLPSRGEWTFPPPPHEPHVLSIDFLPDDPASVLAGVEVGGVILSHDGGDSWEERNEGVYVDVHSVRPDPSAAGSLFAVTGNGFYASEDAGASWERRMEGMGHWYTTGLSVHPGRAGVLLVASGEGPPGVRGRVYSSVDGGRRWVLMGGAEVGGSVAVGDRRGGWEPQGGGVGLELPPAEGRVPVPLLTAEAAWLGGNDGRLYRSEGVEGRWSVVAELPAAINALVGEGSPSSVMH